MDPFNFPRQIPPPLYELHLIVDGETVKTAILPMVPNIDDKYELNDITYYIQERIFTGKYGPHFYPAHIVKLILKIT